VSIEISQHAPYTMHHSKEENLAGDDLDELTSDDDHLSTASEGDPGQIVGSDLEETMSHYIQTNHLAYGFWYSAHTGTFDSLPSADQRVLTQAVKESKAEAEQAVQELNQDNLDTLTSAGVEIVEDFDIEPMREAALEAQRSIFEEHSEDVPMTLDEITSITLDR